MQEIKSPVKAIRAFCLDCCGSNSNEVKNCTSRTCQLKPFRLGKNPYIKRQLTPEQKAAAAERMRKMRRGAE